MGRINVTSSNFWGASRPQHEPTTRARHLALVKASLSLFFYSFLLSPKSNENDNFISCEPDHNAHHELFLNLSVLKKLFINNCYSVITKPVSNGKKVVIAHNEWGHPCFLDINEKKEIVYQHTGYKDGDEYDLFKRIEALSK